MAEGVHQFPNGQYKMGDLVWVHVKGFPWWPGQIMDMSQASEKMLQVRQPHTRLVSTFGDGQFAWAYPQNLVDFAAKYDAYRGQKTNTRNFRLAVEEAKEVMDKRAGAEPVTDHEPLDFLNLREGDNLAAESLVNDAAEFADAATIAQVSVETALNWSRNLASNPFQLCSLISAVPCLLRSWRASRWHKSQRKWRAALKAAESPGAGLESDSSKAQGSAVPAKRRGRPPGTKRGRKPTLPDDDAAKSFRYEQDTSETLGEEIEATPSTKRRRKSGPKASNKKHMDSGGEPQAPLVRAENKSVGHEAADVGKEVDMGGTAGDQEEHDLQDDDLEAGGSDSDEEEQLGTDYSPGDSDGNSERDGEDIGSPARRQAKMARRGGGQEAYDVLDDSSIWRPAEQARMSSVHSFLCRLAASAGSSTGPGSTSRLRSALLLHREKKFGSSCLNSRGCIGSHTEAAVMEVLKLKPPSGKIAGGIPTEVPTVVDSARFKEYSYKVPDNPEAFTVALEAFYKSRDRTFSVPHVDKQHLDLYQIFKAAAARGGYEAVTLDRAWPKIGKEWREGLSRNGQQQIHSKYIQYLLAFENFFTEGVEERIVQRSERTKVKPKTVKVRSGKKAAPKATLMDSSTSRGLGEESDAQTTQKSRVAEESKRIKQARRLDSQEGGKPQAERGRNTAKLGEEKISKPQVGVKSHSCQPPVRKSSKPLKEQKAVLKLKFAQGVEMPSRARLLSEAKKHGEVVDVQLVSKQNTYLFVFADENYAEAACKSLKPRAHQVWRLPEGSVEVFQELYAPRSKQSSMGPKYASPAGVPARSALRSGGEMTAGSAQSQPSRHSIDPRMAAVAPLGSAALPPRATASQRQLQQPRRDPPTDPRKPTAAPPHQASQHGRHQEGSRVSGQVRHQIFPSDPRQNLNPPPGLASQPPSDPRQPQQHQRQLLSAIPAQAADSAPDSALKAPPQLATADLYSILQQAGVQPQPHAQMQHPQMQAPAANALPQPLPSISQMLQEAGINMISSGPPGHGGAGNAGRPEPPGQAQGHSGAPQRSGESLGGDIGNQMMALMRQFQH